MTALDEFPLAVREQILLREALIGPTGSGKTHAALKQAAALVEDISKVTLIDAENGRARLEADVFGQFRHRILKPEEKTPEGFMAATARAYAAGAEVVINDSVSPEWKAVLGDVDRFGDWKKARPRHDDWIASLVNAPGHLIVTIRAKMKYLVSEIEKEGRTKQQIDPLGMGPIQDDNLAYEFDVVGYIDRTHLISFSNRCRPLEGQTMTMDEAAPIVKGWLAEGVAPAPPPAADEKDVKKLRELIAAKSDRTAEQVEETFAQRRAQNRGELHPDYVAEQIKNLEKLPNLKTETTET